mmetsp:Transcript_76908/g.220197  ORF Transcript_76908/g.220197 Transcript_76908/m.220197 type:complete len:209 (-) Transcript_76908:6-632(-)
MRTKHLHCPSPRPHVGPSSMSFNNPGVADPRHGVSCGLGNILRSSTLCLRALLGCDNAPTDLLVALLGQVGGLAASLRRGHGILHAHDRLLFVVRRGRALVLVLNALLDGRQEANTKQTIAASRRLPRPAARVVIEVGVGVGPTATRLWRLLGLLGLDLPLVLLQYMLCLWLRGSGQKLVVVLLQVRPANLADHISHGLLEDRPNKGL